MVDPIKCDNFTSSKNMCKMASILQIPKLKIVIWSGNPKVLT